MNETPETLAGEPPFQVRVHNLGGVLDDAIRLWKRNFTVVLGLCVLVLAPLQTAIDLGEKALSPWIRGVLPEGALLPLDIVFGDIISTLVYAIVSAALVATSYETVLTHLLAQDYMGNRGSLRQSWRAVRRRLPALFVIHIPFYLIFSLLSLFCLLPGILFYAFFVLRIPVTVLEGQPVIPAFARAVRLMFAQWHVGLLLLLLLTPFYLAFAAGFTSIPLIGMFSYNVFSNLVNSLEVAAITVFYFSCRTKRENVDLDLLVRAVDTADGEAHVL